MPRLSNLTSILAAAVVLAPALAAGGENMLIDDFWMREKSSAPAPTRQATPPRSKNMLIDDFWMRGKKSSPPAPATNPTTSRSAPPPPAPARPTEIRPQPTPAPTPAQREGLVPAVTGLPPDPGSDLTYRIGPSDLIKIEVFQVEELSSEERVSEDGQIILPLVGAIQIGGLTPREAEARIADVLGRDYLQNPQVDIDITEYANQQITVMGSVNKPGVFPVTGATSLLQVIAMAEGMSPLAKEDEVIVFRGDERGGMMAYVVDVEAIQEGKLRDPVLIGDDRVVVPESGTSAFIKGVADTLRGFVRVPGVGW